GRAGTRCAHSQRSGLIRPRTTKPVPRKASACSTLRSANEETPLDRKNLGITTKDGEMETFICHPERNRRSPAVFFLMDAYGIREELKDMARRLGTVGYYVLLPNLYYRAGRDTIYGPDVQQDGSA